MKGGDITTDPKDMKNNSRLYPLLIADVINYHRFLVT
jgi:hypothetical protein